MPSLVMQQPSVPLTTHTNEWSDYKIDLEIVQHKSDTTNMPPKLIIKNDVPLQPNIVTQPMNNLMDSNGVMSHSNVMDQIKNDPNKTDKTKQQQQQQQNISSPQVQLHYNEDLLVLDGSTDVDINNNQYYNVNSYVRPTPSAPTLEAIYGFSVPQTNT